MADASKGLRLYNTLTRTKEDFVPIDPGNVRMYVCGPTVYDFAHIGNARPVIVFDVLFRLLRHLYGEDHVTYVRNITDVDDKINARALRDFGGEIASGALSLNEAIRRVTEKTANQFHADVKALGCLEPTFEPRATEFVEPRKDGKTDMIGLIQTLIQRGHAYVAAGEVLFNTASMPDYGQLSKRNLDEQQAGARVAVDAHKKNPGDFVLWKLSSPEEPGWDSPWGRGRPGWHIECSAMSAAYLGEVFDIHGGGLDLIFPHHENEIAQSRCAHGTPVMANYWMHNGFLQVEGQKMSKSLGNFYTINELLETENFSGPWAGSVLKLYMLNSLYREPLDFTASGLAAARDTLRRWLKSVRDIGGYSLSTRGCFLHEIRHHFVLNEEVHKALLDDLNTPKAIVALELLYKRVRAGSTEAAIDLLTTLDTLGLVNPDNIDALIGTLEGDLIATLGSKKIDRLRELQVLTANNATVQAGTIMSEFEKSGVYLALRPGGTISIDGDGSDWLESQIASRLQHIKEKNWAEADRIRDELLAQGIQLKDGKDPVTGERITTWEVKR